jgi:hypothetical protein
MSDALLFQRTVAGLSLEITSEDNDARATITYPYPDPRFELGGFPLAFAILRRLCARLLPPRGVCFLADLTPCTSSETPPETPLDLEPLEEWLDAQRQGTIGSLQPTGGYWLSPSALEEIEALLAPMEQASAEESHVRLLLLEREAPGARGWDLCHEDGITTLGRWRLDLADAPAPLDPEDIPLLQALLEQLAPELAPRLANGKSHSPS